MRVNERRAIDERDIAYHRGHLHLVRIFDGAVLLLCQIVVANLCLLYRANGSEASADDTLFLTEIGEYWNDILVFRETHEIRLLRSQFFASHAWSPWTISRRCSYEPTGSEALAMAEPTAKRDAPA